MQTIAILGSTGSIGTQALELVRLHPEEFRVVALTARSSREKLFEQVREFRPEVAGLTEPIPMSEIPEDVRFCRWVMGADALHAAAAEVPADMVLVSVVGIAGLQSVMDELGANRQVLLANKEALVTGGHLVMDAAKRIGKPILPVDSEHSAIFQCLQGAGGNQPVRLLLTASGGPFRTWTREQMQNATRAQALKHPNWSMGAKITIDSASMFNKALEIIEAHWLFDMPPEKIQVVVHPQSIVHSMVELVDGTVIAQLGVPDMGLPIQLAMTYPERKASPFAHLDFYAMKDMTFEAPDYEKTPCLKLAMDCARIGGTAPCIMSAANEVAVAMFLNHRLGYNRIYDCALQAVESIEIVNKPDLEAVLAADEQARVFVREHFS